MREPSLALRRCEAARDGSVPLSEHVDHEISPRQERWFHYHNELMRTFNFMRLRLVQERGRELRFALARRLRDPVKRAG